MELKVYIIYLQLNIAQPLQPTMQVPLLVATARPKRSQAGESCYCRWRFLVFVLGLRYGTHGPDMRFPTPNHSLGAAMMMADGVYCQVW